MMPKKIFADITDYCWNFMWHAVKNVKRQTDIETAQLEKNFMLMTWNNGKNNATNGVPVTC